jgi:hypothetical protein
MLGLAVLVGRRWSYQRLRMGERAAVVVRIDSADGATALLMSRP